jgi:ferredoxin--NADP+ reductase
MEEGWTEVTVLRRRIWDAGLVTLELDLKRTFIPGQFAQLGVRNADGHLVHRAYSIASKPGDNLEFFIVEVDDGALSPRLVALAPGDTVLVRDKITGFFTVDDTERAEAVWLVSTGTGLAPYLSMLRDGGLWEKYGRAIVVHCVRNAAHLAYADELRAFSASHPVRYLPIVTREDADGAYRGRIPRALEDGWLEEQGQCRLDTNTHAMLCGNPEMVKELTAALEGRGMVRHKRKQPGHIVTERYW